MNKNIINIFISCVTIIGCLVACELAARIRYPYIDLYEITGKKPTSRAIAWGEIDSYAAFKGKPGYRVDRKGFCKTINSYGFVSTPEISPHKREGLIRVLFLGESSTACFDLSDDQSWPTLVVNNLRERFPQAQFDYINGAVQSYTSFETFGRLWSRLRFFKPDIIVYCHGWNEMYYFLRETVPDIVNWRDRSSGWSFDKWSLIRIIEPRPIDPFIRHSQFLTHMRVRFARKSGGEMEKHGGAKQLRKTFDESRLDVWRTNLKFTRAVSDIIGAEFFVCKQATLIAPTLPATEQSRCKYQLHGFDRDAHLKAFRDIYKIIDDEIQADHIIDMTSLSGKPKLFSDHIHLTEAGSLECAAIVAQDLSRWIEEHLDKDGKTLDLKGVQNHG